MPAEAIAPGMPDNQPAAQSRAAGTVLEEVFRKIPQDIESTRESLPKDHFNVDWGAAVREGYIAPKASIDGHDLDDLQVDFDVILSSQDKLLKDVVFSHAIHTYWLNCETCHTKIFLPVEGNVRVTMQDIWIGEYCGRCHGKVAFPTRILSGPHLVDNCLKCHNYEKER